MVYERGDWDLFDAEPDALAAGRGPPLPSSEAGCALDTCSGVGEPQRDIGNPQERELDVVLGPARAECAGVRRTTQPPTPADEADGRSWGRIFMGFAGLVRAELQDEPGDRVTAGIPQLFPIPWLKRLSTGRT
jgi:hypothetical protein